MALKPNSRPVNREEAQVIINIDSYPHPSFPGPNPPSVKEVKLAKESLIELICRSRVYLDAIRRIQADLPNTNRFVLLSVNKVGTSMLTKNVSSYALISHESVWPELLEKVRQSLTGAEKYGGNIVIQRNQDLVTVELVWN